MLSKEGEVTGTRLLASTKKPRSQMSEAIYCVAFLSADRQRVRGRFKFSFVL